MKALGHKQILYILTGAAGFVLAMWVQRQVSLSWAKILIRGIGFALPAYFGIMARRAGRGAPPCVETEPFDSP